MNINDKKFCMANNIPVVEIALEGDGKLWRASKASKWANIENAACDFFVKERGMFLDYRLLLLHIMASRADPDSVDGLAQYSLLSKPSRFSPISWGNLGSTNLSRIGGMISDPEFHLNDALDILHVCYGRSDDIKRQFPLKIDPILGSPILPAYFESQHPPRSFLIQIEANFCEFAKDLPEMFNLTFPNYLLLSLVKLEKLDYEVSQSFPEGETRCDTSLTDFIQSIRRSGRHALPPIADLEAFENRLDTYFSSLPKWRWQNKTWIGAPILSLDDPAVKLYDWTIKNRKIREFLYNLGMLHSAKRADNRNNLWLSGTHGAIDLFMFDPKGRRFGYEVKSPTDSLSYSQRSLLPRLQGAGWGVAVVSVSPK